ncbi:MAG: thermonuclease family protein [Myxococcaceae bacterium]|nr:thermonuclease family protein [Myxococcaceae bacterium]
MRHVGVAAALVLLSCAPESPCGPSSAVVERAIDGDTLELEGGQRVRMLLVDTPESTGGKTDCFGQNAAMFTAARVTGKRVQLAYDAAECRDRFNRLLAFVTVDGVELNRSLTEEGLACVLYIAPAGMARRDEFETYESQAKTSRVGMWGQCATVTCE